MNRAKGLQACLRVANSLGSSPLAKPQFSAFQVTRFYHLSRPSILLSRWNPNRYFCNTHQKVSSSSKLIPTLELILSNDWSKELENELRMSNPNWTHESVIYILNNLDRYPDQAFNFFKWACEGNSFKPSSPVYSLMLRILHTRGSLKRFWIILSEMKEQGFYIDQETYLTLLGNFKKDKMTSDASALTHFYNEMVRDNAMVSLVKEVTDVILGSDWSNDVEAKLEELKITLSDGFVLRALKELRKSPLKALEFFHWADKRSDYSHNSITYNGVLRVLCQNESVGEFWGMFKELKAAGHEMDIDMYIKISRAFQKNAMMDDAVRLYEFMMDGPYPPSNQHCIYLLKAISSHDSPNLDLVFRVTNKYEATGHSLPKGAYDQIHRCLNSLGRFDEAEEITEAMRNAGYTPDNVTYSQEVFGLCKVGRLEEAAKVLDKMESCGYVPDLKTWTILIQGCCSANELDKGLVYFAKMMEKNVDADADLLDVLINAFLHRKKINGAYTLLVEMVEKARLRPWQATYKNMIQKLLGNMNFEEALKLLRLMKRHNYPPCPEPFGEYISKYGTVQDASEFFSVLSSKQCPSVSAYFRMFEAFFKEGRHSEAKDLLYKCPHHIRSHQEIGKLFGSTITKAVSPN